MIILWSLLQCVVYVHKGTAEQEWKSRATAEPIISEERPTNTQQTSLRFHIKSHFTDFSALQYKFLSNTHFFVQFVLGRVIATEIFHTVTCLKNNIGRNLKILASHFHFCLRREDCVFCPHRNKNMKSSQLLSLLSSFCATGVKELNANILKK